MINHFIESQQLDNELLLALIHRADQLRESPEETLRGKSLANLFYEPSTRTRLSFEAAMTNLGGKVYTTENAREFSSAVKGESLEDTIRVVGGYVNAIVLRHYEEGAAKRAADVSKIPIINAGDGKGQHPTQALLDMYTIHRELGRLDDLQIVMVGDLAHGRTVRSLSYLLGKQKDIEIVFVAPEHLRMGDDVKEYLTRHGVAWREEPDLNQVLSSADIVYLTRIQRERMTQEVYESGKGKYIINTDNLNLIKSSARILHPLPKVDEVQLSITTEDTDPRVAYFRQAQNGMYARMALLETLIRKNKKN